MQIRTHCREAGFSMMEVLITMIIILVGLLGIAALQAKAQVAELEAHQRTQGLIMLSDIMDRLNAHRENAACFAFTTNTVNGTPYIGSGATVTFPVASCNAFGGGPNDALASAAIGELDSTLKGEQETLGGNPVPSMIGARACITYDAATEIPGASGTGLYTIVVTWQGMDDLVAPGAGLECAVGLYGDETRRRAVSAQMRLARLL